MPIVYVTNNDPRNNYSALSKYGNVAFLTHGHDGDVHQVIEQVGRALVESKPTDFLCISGDSQSSSIALIMWISVHSQVRLIFFDAYGCRDMTLNKEQLIRRVEQLRDLNVRR